MGAVGIGGQLVGLVERRHGDGQPPSQIGRRQLAGIRPDTAGVGQVVMGQLVAEHPAELLVVELVLSLDLAAVGVVARLDEPPIWTSRLFMGITEF